jgi:uncharacterized phiE125 gp8 family phage protein
MAIALSTIKQALKIDYTADDAELVRIRDAAVAFVSDYTGLSLEIKTNTQFIPYWMKTRFDSLPFVSITSVKFQNSSNVETTMPSTDFFIIKSQPPSTYINFSDFPSIFEGTEIEITYTSGYATLPKHIEQAVIAIIGHWYNNPEAGAPITISTVPLSAQFILDTLRVKGILE